MHPSLLELVSSLKTRIQWEQKRGDTFPLKTLSVLSPSSSSCSFPQSTQALNQLSQEVASCQKCPLGSTRIQTVFGVGSPLAKVMFVGEGPGYEEDRQGEPFVGKAGKLLDNILTSIGLSRKTVYIANIVKCHPMTDPSHPEARGNDRPPTGEEIAACKSYLDRQIELIRPKVIVTLGASASKTLLSTSLGITSLRGKWYTYGTAKLLPTYHPAALLRDPNLKKDVWKDMKSLKKELEN
ncbi:MAG: uracil-DNA glycosylase [Elusimicrobia bacterium]|nr:uracil-DNA glycosylase [Elusimicrobiota bacterium]